MIHAGPQLGVPATQTTGRAMVINIKAYNVLIVLPEENA
jgi:hypothetical protein